MLDQQVSAPEGYTLAVDYTTRGWAVIPVHGLQPETSDRCTCGRHPCDHDNRGAGKHPIETQWTRRGRTSAADCYSLWVEDHPYANVGILTGQPSGIWVLDIDPKNGGDTSLAQLIQQHGPLPDTYRVRTGSGGEHYYFHLPPGTEVTNSARALAGTGIDVRGTGGQVVAAGSRSGIGPYTLINNMTPVEAPAWLAHIVTTPAGQPDLPQHTVCWEDLPHYNQLPPPEQARLAAYALTAIDTETIGYQTAPPGKGNRALFTAACSILEITQSPWNTYTADYAHRILDIARGQRTLHHPDGGGQNAEEFARTLRSAHSRVVGAGRKIPPNPALKHQLDTTLIGAGGTILKSPTTATTATHTAAVYEPAPYDPEPEILREIHRQGIWEEAKRRRAAQQTAAEPARIRRTDLTPFLDGTYTPPTPSIGGRRDDGHLRILYPGRWHSVVSLTSAGKSWFALWHAVQVLRDGGTVMYAHFEETLPAGTLARMRAVAPDLNSQTLADRFIWLDCGTAWAAGEYATQLPEQPALCILDGINAACGQHGWDVNLPATIGTYRQQFVTPATTRGAAVLSLGHPPKAKDRQDERHGFGSTAWLDEVDGVAYRLEAAKKTPIRRGHKGYAALYSVKDRYGEVERHGILESEDRHAGWYYQGAFTVDSSPSRTSNSVAYLTSPQRDDQGHTLDAIDHLAAAIVSHLKTRGGTFSGQRILGNELRAARIVYSDKDLAPALERLAENGTIEWPTVDRRGQSRAGWLTEEPETDETDENEHHNWK